MILSDEPYALKNEAERIKRIDMLQQSHIQPLVSFVESVKKSLSFDDDIPMFDPCDAGVNARLLIFLEAPGRKSLDSKFISRNNPDRTAAKINQLLDVANIKRKDTIIWNIVPWYIGQDDTRKRIRAAKIADIEKALSFNKEFLKLLTKLEVVVLMGKNAQLAKAEIKSMTNALIFCTAHPSPRVVNSWPEKIEEAQQVFIKVGSILNK